MNTILLTGEIITEPYLAFNAYGENFYSFNLSCKRTSGVADVLPCIIPEVFLGDCKVNDRVDISAEIRTRNHQIGTERHLEITVFVNSMTKSDSDEDINEVALAGTICKKKNVRKTPYGRQVIDLIIASNRGYGKSDYIPTIVWGGNAFKVEQQFTVGEKIEALGRLQSREYTKHFADGTEEVRTAYELSIKHIVAVESEE